MSRYFLLVVNGRICQKLIPLYVAGERMNQFQALLDASLQTQLYLYAPGSARNIKSHIRTYLMFCTYFNRVAIPAHIAP